MSAYTLGTPQVYLHWVRETPSRVLALPVSQTLTSLASLPPCVQKAVRATGLAAVELHLPPYRSTLTPDFDAWLNTLRFRQNAVGCLIATCADDPDPLATVAYHHAIVLAIRAVSGDETPLTLIAESAPSALLPQPLPLRHICAPRGGLLPAPEERSHFYHRRYRAVALALQCALRDAVPSAHIATIEQWEDRDHLLALFAWSVAEPIVGRHVDSLVVDVLSTTSLNRACSGLPSRLARRLEDVIPILVRHRVPPLIRNAYDPAKVHEIVRRCRARSRFLHLLFSNEFRLIAALIRFCTCLPRWRERGAADPASVYRQIREEWEKVELHLRYFYQRRSHNAIGSRLLLEAARALEAVD